MGLSSAQINHVTKFHIQLFWCKVPIVSKQQILENTSTKGITSPIYLMLVKRKDTLPRTFLLDVQIHFIWDPHIMNELTERGINECWNFSFLILQLILTDFRERKPALKPLKNHSIVTSGSGTFLNRGLVDQEEVRKQQLNNLIRIVWQTSTTFALQNPQSSRHQNILRIIWQLIIFHSVYFISIQIFVRF